MLECQRKLDIPTVTDRLLKQAISQWLSPKYEGGFSTNSYGFPPGRSAHQAVHQVHYLGKCPNGYISFLYELSKYLNYGGSNVIAVKVDNSKQPNSGWYSGFGIYRNVWLTTVNPVHIPQYGIFVSTPLVSAKEADALVNTIITNKS
ncbi:Beta-galactosidase [Arcticibacter svalbardensis MN12-7]|uniref:Beta-galactosidase n=1 Tax=Arcticibacter svalbardensis MN12-7 TaxID=1150600 RepID=R9H0T8_9SPHI|nr:sugar-binding domain-containing protein [Arcticibacter svalbardensis]EOR94844.1 Beta-galactosidase [Arcticibacter svalbardensis MN12-7]